MTYLSSFMILNNDNVLLNEECYIRKNNDWVLNEIIDKDKFIGYVSYKNKRYQFSHYFRWKFIMVIKYKIHQIKIEFIYYSLHHFKVISKANKKFPCRNPSQE